MKELQDFIPIHKGKIAIARVYFIELTYIFEDGEEMTDLLTDTSYSKIEKAEEIKKIFENSSLPVGVVDVKCKVIPSMVEINI